MSKNIFAVLVIAIGLCLIFGANGFSDDKPADKPDKPAKTENDFSDDVKSEVDKLIKKYGGINKKNESGLTPLDDAIGTEKKIEVIELLIIRGADVNNKCVGDNTPLHIAAFSDNKDLIKLLIARGADISAKNEWDCTPLHNAVSSGRKETVELLITLGADINAKTRDGETILDWSVHSNQPEITKLLKDKGAKTIEEIIVTNEDIDKEVKRLIDYCGGINSIKSDTFPLLMAAYGGHLKVIKKLLEQGANTHTKTEFGVTPLRAAVDSGKKEVIEFFIAKGADVNEKDANGQTLLHDSDKKDVVELLIARGANVNEKDNDGCTPLFYKSLKGSKGAAELLIAKGANVNAKDKDGKTPLHYAATGCRIETVELLIANGADVNAKDKDGITPFHHTVVSVETLKTEHVVKFIELLIAKGADVNAKDKEGNTPLTITFELESNTEEKNNAKITIIALLLKHGAKPGREFSDKVKGEVEDLIKEYGGINGKDATGATPLHFAVVSGKKDVTELLLYKGADVNAKNKYGKTPLDYAKNENIKALLLKFGAKSGNPEPGDKPAEKPAANKHPWANLKQGDMVENRTKMEMGDNVMVTGTRMTVISNDGKVVIYKMEMLDEKGEVTATLDDQQIELVFREPDEEVKKKWKDLPNETIETPAGKFDCKVKINAADGVKIWTCDKVPFGGMVKIISKTLTSELVWFKKK